MQGLIEDYIRDEVFYREGRAAGLDRDDVIIRRRVRQKMEFLAEDMSVAEPTEEQLAAYLAVQSGALQDRGSSDIPSGFPERDAAREYASIATPNRLRALWLAPDAAVDTAALGDPFLLGEEFRAVSQSDVAGIFGEGFAKQLSAMEQGRWQGPISSSFGAAFRLYRANEQTEACRRSMLSGRPCGESG